MEAMAQGVRGDYRGLVLGTALVLAALTGEARAAGPQQVQANGFVSRWYTPVVYNLDPSALGTRTHAQAANLVAQAFAIWTSVATQAESVGAGPDLSVDVTGANVGDFYQKTTGLTPIVFDSDGSAIQTVLGGTAQTTVAGFGTPDIVDPSNGQIKQGFAVFNANLLNSMSDTAVLTVMVHELGHLLGLANSQLNGDLYGNGNPADDGFLPIMFPFYRNLDNPETPPVLTLDDRLSISFLYPNANFVTAGGNFTGHVRSSALTDFRGANVVVAKVGDERASSVSWPSGIATTGTGTWEAHLLPAGQYTIRVEAINTAFKNTQSLGQFTTPPDFTQPESYNSGSESFNPFIDNPLEAIPVANTVGGAVSGLDLLLNQTFFTLQAGESTFGTVFSTGGTFSGFQYVIDPPVESPLSLTFTLTPTPGRRVDMYIRAGQPVQQFLPTQLEATYFLPGNGATTNFVLTDQSNPPLAHVQYFVALINREATPTPFVFSTQVQNFTLTNGAALPPLQHGQTSPSEIPPLEHTHAGCNASPHPAGEMPGLAPLVGFFWIVSRRRRTT
jgi:hypothetical protein